MTRGDDDDIMIITCVYVHYTYGYLLINCVISNVSSTLERYLNLISLFIIDSYETRIHMRVASLNYCMYLYRK